MDNNSPTRKRRGRRAVGQTPAINQLPWKQPQFKFPPLELVSADELEAIHLGSLRILKEIGMEIMSSEGAGDSHKGWRRS